MTDTFDAIIVGAGHNGLICANYLAASGRRVLVLEASEHVGGAARTRGFADGYSVSSAAHLLTMLHKSIIEELKLASHGLRFAARDLHTVALNGRGEQLTLAGGNCEGTGLSTTDRTEYADFHREMLRFSAILAGAFQRRAPRLVDNDFSDKLSLLKLGWDIRRLGRDSMRELMRVGLMNIHDLATDRFESELLRAAIAMDGVLGTAMGPRSPNTVMSYLYRRVGDVFGYNGAALPAGGMGAVGAALAAEAKARGVSINCGARVVRVETDAGRASGVVLESGECLKARIVVSNADPRTTMKTLVGYPQLDTGFVRRIEGIRMRGVTAKLHLALDGLPEFTGLDTAQLGQRLLFAPDLGYMERAFNPAKYRQHSAEPVIEFCVPTLHDPSLAPAGKHVLSAIVQYAPYTLEGGWGNSREGFIELVLNKLAMCAPRIREQIVARELLTPVDLEREFGMEGGHWHHGEIAVDQLLMLRPVPLAAQYAMPIDGLYLCGAGAHPGGGVMGLAGRNAAREIIRLGNAA
ncbi:MAG: NAD(P)/FAD-dependent oxidoreductase [Pseudomonadales bacterium]|jgi:phytoene dehydrogenase-like protein|nr:NAD(P)/FAD-dependent oxidoreductase [Gammaproteobacteria bacterium]MBP6050950.1 NAD(P)/FAD-dependent oxidoreductase [Pseudomonadales bacterium]MBK6582457.1 NAD(P)/FAD-dependent oxidoreductase [Gammaproteobacteria bacterium]MBK7169602.1 NAD(P)/FAD-dependent oxidoreductase [Gammaproteobacteria bacterium]MBK7521276.1 NAD(P)/FAD-dependent oxidoreductase [Gammaproteobacteria bacterium]